MRASIYTLNKGRLLSNFLMLSEAAAGMEYITGVVNKYYREG